jgi:predicted Zn-dependent protease
MFTGTYYNGITSKGYAVHITFTQTGIKLEYEGEHDDVATIIWNPDQIHKGNYIKSHKITLKYGESPIQLLDIDDPTFYPALTAAYPDRKFNARDFEFLRSKGIGGVALMGLGFLVLMVLVYFYVLPPVAEFAASKMPMDMEVKLGDQMYENIMAGYEVNQPLTKKANEYWRALHVSSPYTVNITVVHESQANAFALPGGHIVVFDGIIHQMNDYDELAGLLAHEYSHISLHHSARMLSRNLAGYLFISLLLNDASGTISILATNANSLKELSFSRELEHQADKGGYELLQTAHIDPNAMMKLFETLKKATNNSISIPQFISTHPLTDERISYIHDRVKKDNNTYTEDHSYLRQIWSEMKADD